MEKPTINAINPITDLPRRKNRATETSERSNVQFPLWRKKVDNSIFRDSGTTVPNWVCRLWQFDAVFPGIVKSSDDVAKVAVKFEGRAYEGRVVSTHPEGRAKKVYRFYFDETLQLRLKEVFLLSHMRDLESRLRADSTNIETQIPFWEFLDIEFELNKKNFTLLCNTNRCQLSHNYLGT